MGEHSADRTVRSDTQQHVLARAASGARHILSVVEGYAPVTVAHVLRFPAIQRHRAGDVLLKVWFVPTRESIRTLALQTGLHEEHLLDLVWPLVGVVRQCPSC